MEHENIIHDIEAYAEETGLAVSTICERATGNSRLLGRIKRRFSQTETDVRKLRAYMAAHPPQNERAAQ